MNKSIISADSIKTLKIDYNDNIYRMVDIPPTFDNLKKMVSEQCKIQPPFTIKYLDEDSDLVAICNDTNLQQAYQYASKQTQGILKIKVNLIKQSETPNISIGFQEPINSLANRDKVFLEQSMTDSNFIDDLKQGSLLINRMSVQSKGSMYNQNTQIDSVIDKMKINFNNEKNEIKQDISKQFENSILQQIIENSKQFQFKCIKCEGIQIGDCKKCQGAGFIVNSKKIQLIEFLIKNQLMKDFPELLSNTQGKINGIQQNNISLNSNQRDDMAQYQCNNCKNKIKNIRYHCAICDDLDFCQQCEASDTSHNHPFIKKKIVSNIKNNRSISPQITDYKCEFEEKQANVDIVLGQSMTIMYKVKNVGDCKWPPKCYLKCIDGLYFDQKIPIEKQLDINESFIFILDDLKVNQSIEFTYSSWRMCYLLKKTETFFGEKVSFQINQASNNTSDFMMDIPPISLKKEDSYMQGMGLYSKN